MKYLMLPLLVVFLISCSEEEYKVNLLGEWRYTFTIKDPACEGVEAIGIRTYQSLNGDLSKIGNIVTQGEYFSTDGIGGCYLENYYFTNTTYSGRASHQTREQLQDNEVESLKLNNNNSNLNVKVDIPVLEDNNIKISTTVSSQDIRTMDLTRQ